MKHIPPPPPLPHEILQPPVIARPVTLPAPPTLPSTVTATYDTDKSPQVSAAGEAAKPLTAIQKVLGGAGTLLSTLIVIFVFRYFASSGVDWVDVTAKYANNPALMATPEYQTIQGYLKSYPGCELRFLEVTFTSSGGKHSTGFTVKGKSLKIPRKGKVVQLHPCPSENKSIDLKVERNKSAKATFWVIADAELAKEIDAKSIAIEYEEGYSDWESYQKLNH